MQWSGFGVECWPHWGQVPFLFGKHSMVSWVSGLCYEALDTECKEEGDIIVVGCA